METGELKNNQKAPNIDDTELERQKQWAAIAKSFDTDDYSDLEAAVDEAKSFKPEPESKPEPEQEQEQQSGPATEASEEPSTEVDQKPIQENEQNSEKKYISVEESKLKEQLAEKELFKKILDDRRVELAELYAKNRRLIPGSNNKSDFIKARNGYEDMLDNYLKAEASIAKITYEIREKELNQDLQAKLDELNAEEGDKEAKVQALKEAYSEECKKVKDEVNQVFLKNFLKQQNELSEETIRHIDEGNGKNLFRKAVHAFRSNKYIKGALIVAGVAGLTVATAGLASGIAAGTISVGFNLTAGGALAGAARGATAGLIASRQDSKNSAIHSFQNDNTEEIQQLFEELGDVTDKHVSTKNVASWLMAEYNKANTTDRQDNRKRTLIATGLGAAFGALSSGVQISKSTFNLEQGQITKPSKVIDVSSNLDKVNIAEGRGAYDTFTQMGGSPDKIQEALDIMHSVDAKYGLVPGDSGVTGSFAHTYPGPISSWPDAAQAYIEEVAKEWAKRGLIRPEIVTVNRPVYGPLVNASQAYIYEGLPRYIADFAIGATTGTIVGDVKNRQKTSTENSKQTEKPNRIEISQSSPENTIEKDKYKNDAIEAKDSLEEVDARMRELESLNTIEKDKYKNDAIEAKNSLEEVDARLREMESLNTIEKDKYKNDAIEAKNSLEEVDARLREMESLGTEVQTATPEATSQEFESKLKDNLALNGIDFLEDEDINLILTPTNAARVNAVDIENLANKLTWKNKKALKDFFNQPENRNLMTTQFGEWIIHNTPDEDPLDTYKHEQSWQV